MAEYREIVRVFGLARDCQNSLHKKKIPNEFVLGTGHVTFFYPRLGYITKRYDSLCEEMIKRGYTCNRVPREELHQDIRAGLFQDYTPTQTAIELNRERIAQNNVKSELKKLKRLKNLKKLKRRKSQCEG